MRGLMRIIFLFILIQGLDIITYLSKHQAQLDSEDIFFDMVNLSLQISLNNRST